MRLTGKRKQMFQVGTLLLCVGELLNLFRAEALSVFRVMPGHAANFQHFLIGLLLGIGISLMFGALIKERQAMQSAK